MYYGFYDEVGGRRRASSGRSSPTRSRSSARSSSRTTSSTSSGSGCRFSSCSSAGPGLALVGLPQLLANALSDFRSMTDPRYHSVAAIAPFLVAATVLAIARVRPGQGARGGGRPRRLGVAGARRRPVAARGRGDPARRSREPAGEQDRGAAGRARARARRRSRHLEQRGRRPPLRAAAGVQRPGARRRGVGRRRPREPWVTRPDSPILTSHPDVVFAFVKRLERDPGWTAVFARDGVVVFRATGR